MSKINKSTVNQKGKKIEFNAKNYERPGLSADEVEEIKEAFDIFDADQNGTISVAELLNAMKSLGFDTKNPAIYTLCTGRDFNGVAGHNALRRACASLQGIAVAAPDFRSALPATDIIE